MQLEHRLLDPVGRHAVDASAFQVQAQGLAVHSVVIHHQNHRLGRNRRHQPGQCLAFGVTQDVVMLNHGRLIK
ncbi:hypothetical protein D3C81_1642280 [compost metagenome]